MFYALAKRLTTLKFLGETESDRQMLASLTVSGRVACGTELHMLMVGVQAIVGNRVMLQLKQSHVLEHQLTATSCLDGISRTYSTVCHQLCKYTFIVGPRNTTQMQPQNTCSTQCSEDRHCVKTVCR